MKKKKKIVILFMYILCLYNLFSVACYVFNSVVRMMIFYIKAGRKLTQNYN